MKIAKLLVLSLLVSFAAPAFGAIVIDFGTGVAGSGGTSPGIARHVAWV